MGDCCLYKVREESSKEVISGRRSIQDECEEVIEGRLGHGRDEMFVRTLELPFDGIYCQLPIT